MHMAAGSRVGDFGVEGRDPDRRVGALEHEGNRRGGCHVYTKMFRENITVHYHSNPLSVYICHKNVRNGRLWCNKVV
jgi:hypothetical protein